MIGGVRQRTGGSPTIGWGFTLIELAVVLTILGIMTVVFVALTPALTVRARMSAAAAGLGDATVAVAGFIKAENRLPCPDVDADGNEDCLPATNEVGTLPWRLLGASGPLVDQEGREVRYGVYRNPGSDADLAQPGNLFEPALPGQPGFTVGTVFSCFPSEASHAGSSFTRFDPCPLLNLNQLDLCVALGNAIRLPGVSASEVRTVNTPGGIAINPGYLLASGGVADRDGDNVDPTFDGFNEDVANALDFDSPAREVENEYDDLVRSVSMMALYEEFACSRNLAAMKALTESAVLAENTAIETYNNHGNKIALIDAANAGVELAETQVELEALKVALSEIELLHAGIQVILAADGPAAAAAAVALAAAIADLGGNIANFAGAAIALGQNEDVYEDACDEEPEARTEFVDAVVAFGTARDRGIEADTKGGVE